MNRSVDIPFTEDIRKAPGKEHVFSVGTGVHAQRPFRRGRFWRCSVVVSLNADETIAEFPQSPDSDFLMQQEKKFTAMSGSWKNRIVEVLTRLWGA